MLNEDLNKKIELEPTPIKTIYSYYYGFGEDFYTTKEELETSLGQDATSWGIKKIDYLGDFQGKHNVMKVTFLNQDNHFFYYTLVAKDHYLESKDGIHWEETYNIDKYYKELMKAGLELDDEFKNKFWTVEDEIKWVASLREQGLIKPEFPNTETIDDFIKREIECRYAPEFDETLEENIENAPTRSLTLDKKE